MAKKGFYVLLFFLVPMLAGCSGYKIAAMPISSEIEGQAESDRPVLREKMHARVHLKSGEVYNGEVVRVSDTEVTIGRAGNFGFEETTFKLEEIEKIEVPAGSKVASAVLGTTGIIAFSLSALVILVLVFGKVE